MLKWLYEVVMQAIVMVFTTLTNTLSFSSHTESMADALNHKLDEPPTKMPIRVFSHPGGFIRELSARRLSIASAYIKIARDFSPEDVDERLGALRMMVDQSFHAKGLTMPLNTARVQIQLMKEAVKSRGNKRRQLEAMADFDLASFGQEAVIREFLNEFHLVEVPEEELPLKELNMGWDSHVHDTLSEGRKTPTQVLLDAFVKGISELTMVYSNLEQRRMMHEAITAGNILGIRVSIGIEFSAGRSGERRHYMFVPPTSEDSAAFFKFFDDRRDKFRPFVEGLMANAALRRKTMTAAIERFNVAQRTKLNQGLEADNPLFFPALSIDDLDKLGAFGHVSRLHVGELLFTRFKEVFQRRVLFMKAQVLAARERFKRGIFSEWELKNITSQYNVLRDQFETMTPESLLAQYMDAHEVGDYDSSFPTDADILPLVAAQGGRIVFIHPLEMGLRPSMRHVIQNAKYITHVETFNLRDSVGRNPTDVNIFNKFVYLINNVSVDEVMAFFEQHEVNEVSRAEVEAAAAIFQKRPLEPVCGSDATGRDPSIPGMGFVRVTNVPEKMLPKFKEHHYKLPRPIADLIVCRGKKSQPAANPDSSHDIICMGKIGKPIRNSVGDEAEVEVIGPDRFWNYLNPLIKNLIRIAIGFTIATWSTPIVERLKQVIVSMGLDPRVYAETAEFGLKFAILWFLLTAFRNIIVDLLSASGIEIKAWSYQNINFDNVAQSLFWTGFSVPLLTFVKEHFDIIWFALYKTNSGAVFETVKFFFLCTANGTYIMTHNRLRGFDKKVRRANFFRSMLAWPFAASFSWLGNALGVPSIVQTKFWSECVAACIEGTGKYQQRFRLRKRDLSELLPLLQSVDRNVRLTTMLDILYIWARQPRGNTCLEQLLLQQPSWFERWRKAKLTPAEREHLKGLYRGYYDRLIELFGDPGCQSILCSYVLRNYNEREAVILTELVGMHAEDFLRSLRHLRKILYPPDDPKAQVRPVQ